MAVAKGISPLNTAPCEDGTVCMAIEENTGQPTITPVHERAIPRHSDAVGRRLKALAVGQLSGQSADDVTAGLRRQVSGAHVIWFRHETDRVLIIRILHQSRDVGRWLG